MMLRYAQKPNVRISHTRRTKMSEWYENKTIKELDGKRVRVEYENGTVVEGVLSRIGGTLQIHLGEYGTNVVNVLDNVRRGVKVNRFSDNIKLITPLGDGNMTRIDDIDDVRYGDTFVGTDGKQFKVIDVDFNDTRFRLRVTFAGGEFWIKNDYFAYALHPTPQLPTEPGLYGDTSNSKRLWVRDETQIYPWTLVVKDLKAGIVPYSDEETIEELDGATLYPVEIKQVES
jgi:small nuclear ribonucleoprotein (snRNP)-like protein